MKGCSDKVWYIPKDVYIWHFKPNSITRIKQGMYGQDSGYKDYLDNMVWQILELQKRFVNKNYILSEMVNIFCVLYHFHVENMQNCPLNTEASMNWIRGYYDLIIRPHENEITETMMMQAFAQTAAQQNIAAKGIVPTITFKDFWESAKEPWVVNPDDEVRGSTPAGYIPPITDKNWPVEVTEYTQYVERPEDVDSNTNFSRFFGMKKKLGLELDEKDYDMNYDGSTGKAGLKNITQSHPSTESNPYFIPTVYNSHLTSEPEYNPKDVMFTYANSSPADIAKTSAYNKEGNTEVNCTGCVGCDSQSDSDEIAHKNPSRKFGSYTPSTDASDHDEILGGAPEYTVDTDGVESNE